MPGFAVLPPHAVPKQLQDTDAAEGVAKDFQITDYFLSKAGLEALREVCIMVTPQVFKDMKFETIRRIILDKMHPRKRLIIAERTRFLATRQGPTKTVRQYIQRLREATKFCEFEKLNTANATQSADD